MHRRRQRITLLLDELKLGAVKELILDRLGLKSKFQIFIEK